MSTPTVFLSAASIDLREWREVLDGAFRRGGFRVLTQDQSLASAPGNVRRLLVETIAESDCIVHLAGLGYGKDATDPFPDAPDFQCSWTQFEYYHGHREKKDVIAFVCAPSLSKAGFTETGTDAADIARKQRLQAEHRRRVENGTFENTPLPNTPADRTSNESIASVGGLLTAVAAAVGTLHKLDREACAKAQQELTQLARELAEVKHEVVKAKEEVVKTRRFGTGAFAILCLMLVLLGAGVWQIMQGQKPNPERIRAAYREASERKLAEDNAAGEKAATSAERQRLHEAAAAAHAARLARIEYHVADFIRLADDPATTFVMREMIRILSDPKEKDRVKTALDYADKQKAGVLERIRARNAAIDAAQHEHNRTELQPLLKAADLQATSGQAAKARASYAQLLELEPDWPEALSGFAWFLRDQSTYAQSYANLKTALADAQQAQKLAQRLLDQAPDNRDSQRLLSVSLNQLGDLAVAQGDLAGALRSFTESKTIAERLAASDPANAEGQYDLGISNERLGDLAVQQGRLDEALVFHTKRKDIISALAASDPANAAWQRDLSYSCWLIAAKIFQPQQRWAEALALMEQSLRIDERLAANDPTNVTVQNDVQVSRQWVAELRAKVGAAK